MQQWSRSGGGISEAVEHTGNCWKLCNESEVRRRVDALAMAGDSGKAKAGTSEFSRYGKDRGCRVPILKEANAEYAKLQQ